MTRTHAILLCGMLSLAAVPRLAAYERMMGGGSGLRASVPLRFTVNPDVRAGFKNGKGEVMVTAESDPVVALEAATRTWSSVSGSTLRVTLAVNTGTVSPKHDDGVNVFSFEDSAGARSVVGDAIAVTTTYYYPSSGVITDSDILFNPDYQYSTTLTLNCFDLQSIATHELGHAVGADHVSLGTATMFAYSDTEESWTRQLSSDDVAFVKTVYPLDRNTIGTVSGKVAYASGAAVADALVLVFNTAGNLVTGMKTGTTGYYSLSGIPPGNYYVSAQPVSPYMGGDSSGSDAFDTPDWQAVVHGGTEPQAVAVTGGATSTVNLTVPTGKAKLRIEYVICGDDYGPSSYLLASGTSTEIGMAVRGLPATVKPEDILVYGAGITVRADSISVEVLGDPADGVSYLDFIVDVAARSEWGEAVLALRNGDYIAPEPGFRARPSGPAMRPGDLVSAASFIRGAVAPGEIVSLAGNGLGPGEGASGAFGQDEKLESAVSGVTVEFDGTPAPLFYVAEDQINAQVPFEVAGHASTRVKVQYQDRSTEFILPVAAARPEVFDSCDGSCIFNEDGTFNSEEHPAARGSYVVIYGTGQGLLEPALETGAPAGLAPLSRATVTAAIGGVDAAAVDFAGMTPGFVGLLQVNLKVPDTAPVGWADLLLKAKGVPSRGLAWVRVKQ